MEKPIVAGKDITAELPLSLYEAMSIGGMSLPDGEALSIQIGLSKDMVEKLKQHARNEEDTELQANTSDYRRFVENSYEAWYMKDRTPFALVSATGELAAIIWFGPENPPHKEKGLWDTVAFRSYPPYRGKGIMTPFGKFALTTYTMLRPDRSIWLETGSDNQAGKALYAKLGFIEHSYQEHAGRVLMTLPSTI